MAGLRDSDPDNFTGQQAEQLRSLMIILLVDLFGPKPCVNQRLYRTRVVATLLVIDKEFVTKFVSDLTSSTPQTN